jgi:hypothetical protein
MTHLSRRRHRGLFRLVVIKEDAHFQSARKMEMPSKITILVLTLFKGVVFIGLAAATGSSTAAAQSAAITGTVFDESNAVVADVEVIAFNEAIGLERKARTDQKGWFIIHPLPPGVYRLVTTSGHGFGPVQKEVIVDPNAVIEIYLETGGPTEDVTVRGSH